MTNPRDPEGLMPDADEAGPPIGADGELPRDSATGDDTGLDSGLGAGLGSASGGLDQSALADRTDTDEFGSDPDMRFPGDAEDPTMTTADETASDGGASLTDRDPMG
jgi:hypothetical protein